MNFIHLQDNQHEDYSNENSDYDSDEYDYDYSNYYDEDSRIVGGFDAPDPVPWYVMLKILTANGTKPNEESYECGGTLITPRFDLKVGRCHKQFSF